MKRTTMGSVLLAVVALMVPALAPAQVVGVGMGVGQEVCPEGSATGTLGISGLDCRGECTLTMNEKGEEQAWSFTIEPQVTAIEAGGPADGVLQAGDALVAIDGVPITTKEGGRLFANVEPNRAVRIQFRRDGRLAEVTLRTGSTCPPPPPLAPDAVPEVAPFSRVTVGRRVPPFPPDTVGGVRRTRIGVAPRIVVAGTDTVVGRVGVVSRVAPRPVREAPEIPEGRLGISFSCGHCTGSLRDGVYLWDFSGPIEVIGLDSGGPADLAGIQLGDQIRAVNGRRVESRQGGEDFSLMTPGEALELTVVKRSGREETVTVVPVTDETLATTGRLRVRDAVGIARRPEPDAGRVVRRVDQPVPALAEPPEGMPLRYSGTVGGVEVEVRGAPVTVSEVGGARIILINADGLWIRIRVPATRRDTDGRGEGGDRR
jgi:membrane-associated protease RseP (regulator of RpoE activity)